MECYALVLAGPEVVVPVPTSREHSLSIFAQPTQSLDESDTLTHLHRQLIQPPK